MRKSWVTSCIISPLVVFGIFIVMSNNTLAYQQPAPHGGGSPTPGHGALNNRTLNATPPASKAVAETYAVVAVGEDIKVFSKTDLKSLPKQLDEDYKLEMKKYQDAKKDKNNRGVNTPKPVKKTVHSISQFKTKEEAQKFADEEIQKRDKGGVKKTTSVTNNW